MAYKDPQKAIEYGRKYSKIWYARNIEKVALDHRERVLIKAGWTVASYEAALISQNYKCAICDNSFNLENKGRKDSPCADHNHKTNVAREILCSSCNLLLGQAHESEETLIKASEYLRKHNSDA